MADEKDILGDSELEDLTVLDAEDPALGLTNIGEVPAEDWAADTGPTQTAEGDDGPVMQAPDDAGEAE